MLWSCVTHPIEWKGSTILVTVWHKYENRFVYPSYMYVSLNVLPQLFIKVAKFQATENFRGNNFSHIVNELGKQQRAVTF